MSQKYHSNGVLDFVQYMELQNADNTTSRIRSDNKLIEVDAADSYQQVTITNNVVN